MAFVGHRTISCDNNARQHKFCPPCRRLHKTKPARCMDYRVLSYVFRSVLSVGGKQTVQAGGESTTVKSATRIVSTSDEQNNDDIITYPSSPSRGSRAITVPVQPPPPPAAYTLSRRCVDEARTTPDDRDTVCWRQREVDRGSTRHHICTLPHGRRAPVTQPLRHYPLWN